MSIFLHRVYFSNSIDLHLIDYGLTERGVTSVLKIDPSVQRFATIVPFARKFSLAFVKPVSIKLLVKSSI